MANPRPSLPPRSRIADDTARPRRPVRRWIITAGTAAALLLIAWWDGGERALRPIAQPVDLPEQVQ